MTDSREREVTRAFLSISDHLVSGDDAVDLLTELASSAVRLLDVSSCGVLLADDQGELHVVAASSDAVRTLEFLQVQCDEGPCLECFRSGKPVSVPDLSAEASDWPVFVDAALALGLASAHAFPLRLRDTALGTLNLFGTKTGELSAEDADLAEALGHVAGIALVAQRVAADQKQLTEQLQHALDSRVVLEQSKGVVAAAGDLDMDQAFRVIRKYARDRNLGLTAVARAIVDRDLPPDHLLEAVRR